MLFTTPNSKPHSWIENRGSNCHKSGWQQGACSSRLYPWLKIIYHWNLHIAFELTWTRDFGTYEDVRKTMICMNQNVGVFYRTRNIWIHGQNKVVGLLTNFFLNSCSLLGEYGLSHHYYLMTRRACAFLLIGRSRIRTLQDKRLELPATSTTGTTPTFIRSPWPRASLPGKTIRCSYLTRGPWATLTTVCGMEATSAMKGLSKCVKCNTW